MDILENRFLHFFSLEAREKIIRALKFSHFEDHSYLFQEGDTADGVDLVVEGQVEIMKITDQKKVILSVVSPGDYFGEIGVLDGLGRSTSARARGNVVIATAPTAVMLEVLSSESGAVSLSLFDKILKNLRHTNNLLVAEIVNKQKMHLVGEMASSLIHDFRNPLSGVIMAADYLKTIHPDDETSHWCNLIMKQSERMTEMSRELLEFARGESNLTVERSSLKTFFQNCNNLLGDILRKRGVEIIEKIEDCELEIDSMRILRVFQNLMTNAADAMNEQIVKKLEIAASCSEGKVTFTIQDNGPGIPEEVQAHMFEPFITHGKKDGTGLGMAIVLKIVRAHGGNISFATAPGAGTCFTITVPQFHTRGADLVTKSVAESPAPMPSSASATSVTPVHNLQDKLPAPILPPPAPEQPMESPTSHAKASPEASEAVKEAIESPEPVLPPPAPESPEAPKS